jgi:hypothetical protein
LASAVASGLVVAVDAYSGLMLKHASDSPAA